MEPPEIRYRLVSLSRSLNNSTLPRGAAAGYEFGAGDLPHDPSCIDFKNPTICIEGYQLQRLDGSTECNTERPG